MINTIVATVAIAISIGLLTLWSSLALRGRGPSRAEHNEVRFGRAATAGMLLGIIAASCFGGAMAGGAMAPSASTLSWLIIGCGVVSTIAAFGISRLWPRSLVRNGRNTTPSGPVSAEDRVALVAVVLTVFSIAFAIYQLIVMKSSE